MTDQPEKFDLSSDDVAARKRAELKRLYPEVFTEDRIDFDQLRRAMGDWVDPGPERFGLNWPGKAACMRVIQAPATGTLRPDRDESVSFDETENVFIEGDNLEVLKLMQKAYFGKVKMIYIDPPYNTGKEFIYPDRYAENLDTYLEYTGQKDAEGRTFSTNTDASGRFHSRWLNMMYPRLYLAKNLLREDGVIFISIDDNEIHRAMCLMDHIFGEENYLTNLIWNTDGHTDNQYDVKINHEYILVYCKNESELNFNYVIDRNTRKESNVWKGIAINSITKNGPKNPSSDIVLPIGFPCAEKEILFEKSDLPDQYFSDVDQLGYISREKTKSYGAEYPIRKTVMKVENGALVEPCTVFSGWANKAKLQKFIDNDFEPIDDDGSLLKFYLSGRGVLYYHRDRGEARNIVSVLRNLGTTEQASSSLEQNQITYDYPKPVELISYLVSMIVNQDDIVLDFFAGSGTTGEAVANLSGVDKNGAKYVLVQLPEVEKTARVTSLSQIARDRLRATTELDFGFRAFRLTPSTFAKWDATTDDTPKDLQLKLEQHAEHLSADATDEDILFELLLKDGFELTTKIDRIDIPGGTVHAIAGGALLICLERSLTRAMIDALADLAEANDAARVVCLDAGFDGNDELKTNAVQTFKSRMGEGADPHLFRTV